jgi:hypothetical protein
MTSQWEYIKQLKNIGSGWLNVGFQQYFSYIMATSLVVEEAGLPGEYRRPWTSNW